MVSCESVQSAAEQVSDAVVRGQAACVRHLFSYIAQQANINRAVCRVSSCVSLTPNICMGP